MLGLSYDGKEMIERWDFAPAGAAEFPNDNPALHSGATWACLGVVGPLRPIVRARPRPTAAQVVPEVAGVDVTPEARAEVCEPEPGFDAREALSAGPCGDPAESATDERGAEPGSEAHVEPVVAEAGIAEPSSGPVTEEAAVVVPAPLPEAGPEPVQHGGIEAPEVLVQEVAPAAEPGRPGLAACAAEERSGDPEDPYMAYVAALTAAAMAAGASRAAALLASVLDGSARFEDVPEETLGGLVRAGMVEPGRTRVSASFVATADAWRRVLRNESSDFSAVGTATLDVWSADLLRALGVGVHDGFDVRKELRRRGVAAFGMRLAA